MDSTQFETMYKQSDQIMGPFADMLLQQSKFPPPADSNSPLVVLDTACGSGVVSRHIMSLLSPEAKSRLDLTAADISEAMITHVAKRFDTEGWSKARAIKADAMVSSLHKPPPLPFSPDT